MNRHRLLEPSHLPERPSWDCAACGQPWPCDAAREEAASTLDAVLLPIYMSAQMYDAAGEIEAVQPHELFDRFVAWTRPARAAIGRAAVAPPPSPRG